MCHRTCEVCSISLYEGLDSNISRLRSRMDDKEFPGWKVYQSSSPFVIDSPFLCKSLKPLNKKSTYKTRTNHKPADIERSEPYHPTSVDTKSYTWLNIKTNPDTLKKQVQTTNGTVSQINHHPPIHPHNMHQRHHRRSSRWSDQQSLKVEC